MGLSHNTIIHVQYLLILVHHSIGILEFVYYQHHSAIKISWRLLYTITLLVMINYVLAQ
jgi:hypothetical protein